MPRRQGKSGFACSRLAGQEGVGVAVVAFLEEELFPGGVGEMLEDEAVPFGFVVAEGIDLGNVFAAVGGNQTGRFVGLPAHPGLIPPGAQPFLTWILAVTVASADHEILADEEPAPVVRGRFGGMVEKQLPAGRQLFAVQSSSASICQSRHSSSMFASGALTIARLPSQKTPGGWR